MSDLEATLTEIALNPAYHDILTVLKVRNSTFSTGSRFWCLTAYLTRSQGARNGLVYGAKIRFPHALVMTILFGRGTVQERLMFVYRATKQHATNLLKFVTIYKTLTILQRNTNGGKPRSLDSLLAGLVGGYVVFGERNAVNEQVSPFDGHASSPQSAQDVDPFQIVLYCTARVVSSLLPREKVKPDWPAHKPIPTDKTVFKYFAAITWALVMWNFAERRQSLQNGLVNSMDCESCPKS